MARSTPARKRPFYSEYAWAYDLLVDRPVRKECAAIAAWLVERGVRPGAEVLDAGCGTGRYAVELARRGYLVQGIDRSPELIEIAKQSSAGTRGAVSFAVGDLLTLQAGRYDAILCRGVLNDLLNDRERQAALTAFAKALRPAGVSILDVREWETSASRKAREPLFRKRVATDRGLLEFTATTALDRRHRRLLVAETHTLTKGRRRQSSECEFVMRCWTPPELDRGLKTAGFDRIAYFGAYDRAVPAGETDRLVAVAQRAGNRQEQLEARVAAIWNERATHVIMRRRRDVFREYDPVGAFAPGHHTTRILRAWIVAVVACLAMLCQRENRGRKGATAAAVGKELDVIAAVVIGGASLSGGVGGSLIGAFLMSVLASQGAA